MRSSVSSLLLSLFLNGILWVYRILSELFMMRGCCRFVPSCSAYMKQAVLLHGWWHGGYLTFKRLMRCHPWGDCGYDPVPCKKNSRS